jgi:hypothetical protein
MKHKHTCIIAIVGWYLLYPPATRNSGPDFYPALSRWYITRVMGLDRVSEL